MPRHPPVRLAPDEITLIGLAEEAQVHVVTVYRWMGEEGAPAPVRIIPRGRGVKVYRRAPALAYVRARKDDKRPAPVTLDLPPDTRVTLYGFARAIGQPGASVYQYQDRPGFPRPAADGTYELGVLLQWWNSRPGPGRPRRR
ncbi:hypothetical protein [Streptomyces paromomycinus]|uniref:Uncharacterized protein n=1 Tax=Streptomyces paromomycinus TaxID=92743 RepID=A0A401VUS5_STREY|nr:hypothetical protein [Streptomyces paromomycinus]GCD40823.1 hypothetical protein GKJPGBOP_00476 [Streptomyces paromomycinus]